MNKYSLVRLMENEGDEDRPSSGLKATYNLVVTPTRATPNEVVVALDNIANYGIYMSNLRTRFSNQYDEKFGTVYDRRAGRKPPVTKSMENDFYASLLKDKKTRLLTPTIEGDTVVFYQKDNPKKDVVSKMLKTVLKNAGIAYTTSEKES